MSETSPPPLSVGIIGCGLIGTKRALALGRDRVVACQDSDPDRADVLAGKVGAQAFPDVASLLETQPDAVIVATIHSALTDLAIQALESGAHVLVEKPAGIGTRDIDRLISAARSADRAVHVGFNHRFHPGIDRAISEATSGRYGDVLYVRGRYGHGGRLGYEKEWRADPALSGGGEIVDQGMHLLDISRCVVGELPLNASLLRTQFWEAPVDDNAVLILGEPGGIGSDAPFSLLHVSWTEWKNQFSLEIACRTAKFAVDGLTGSYGPQRLRIYRMRPELGPPDLEEIDYPNEDSTWEAQWAAFSDAVARGEEAGSSSTLQSARYCWEIVEQAQRA